mmetsp:Transcript_9093/g.13610  ORF Transcript_9093/g.13610 Transcript_9093/m.13610 type:complete len:108 (+) Transcript_9093:789-1112(+)
MSSSRNWKSFHRSELKRRWYRSRLLEGKASLEEIDKNASLEEDDGSNTSLEEEDDDSNTSLDEEDDDSNVSLEEDDNNISLENDGIENGLKRRYFFSQAYLKNCFKR